MIVARKSSKKPAKKKPAAKRRNRTVIKAKRVTVVSANPKRRRANKAGHISVKDIANFPPAIQAQIRAQMAAVEEQESNATTPAQRKRVTLKKRSLLARIRTRLNVIRKAKKFTVTARDTARCPQKKIKVRALTADNALAQAKNKLGSRYDRLKVRNGKKCNGTKKRAKKRTGAIEEAGKFVTSTAKRTLKVTGRVLTGVGKVLSNPKPKRNFWPFSPSKAQKAEEAKRIRRSIRELQKEMAEYKRQHNYDEVEAYKELIAWEKKNLQKVAPRRKRKRKSSGGWFSRNATATASQKPGASRKRRNDGAADRREEFAGKVTGQKDLWFPEGTPAGLSTLGPLVAIETEAGTVKPHLSGAYLCQDARGHLHIGSSRQAPLWNGPAESFGKVKRVEYTCAKPHLGETKTVTWYHDFESPLPELRADGKGGIRFVGGGYSIRREGIVG